MSDTANTAPRRFSAVMGILGIREHNSDQGVHLDGVDISRFIRGLNVSMDVGELTSVEVKLNMIPIDHHDPDKMAIDMPECLASVVAYDPDEMAVLRMALDEAITMLRNTLANEGIKPSEGMVEFMHRADRLTSGPDAMEAIGSYIRRRGSLR